MGSHGSFTHIRNNGSTVNNVLELYTLMYCYNLCIKTFSFVKLPAPLLFLCLKQMRLMVLIILDHRADDSGFECL